MKSMIIQPFRISPMPNLCPLLVDREWKRINAGTFLYHQCTVNTWGTPEINAEEWLDRNRSSPFRVSDYKLYTSLQITLLGFQNHPTFLARKTHNSCTYSDMKCRKSLFNLNLLSNNEQIIRN